MATRDPATLALIQDPRNVVTEDAFRLDPDLLGTPLARPWRRGMAMAIDGMMIGLLSNAPGVLLGLAAALVLFRVSARPAEGSYVRYSFRLMFRFWGAVVLFVVAILGWRSTAEWIDGFGEEPRSTAGAPVAPALPSAFRGVEGIRTAADFALFQQAPDEAQARTRAERMVPALRQAGMDDDDIREVVTEIAGASDKPWLATAVDSVLAGLGQAAAAEDPSPDSLAVAYAAALTAGDVARTEELRPALAQSLAADTVAALEKELQDARTSRSELAQRLEEEREEGEGMGVMAALRAFADDLGLGLGWSGLYFTAFAALWGGYTPGKRLLRIRVIRLDGKPIGWWAAFERFGGYAAGIATGLLGFFQIYWDRNRQAVHDKIAETVVINA